MDDETEPTQPTPPGAGEPITNPVPTGDEIDADATAPPPAAPEPVQTKPVQTKRKKPRKLRHKRKHNN